MLTPGPRLAPVIIRPFGSDVRLLILVLPRSLGMCRWRRQPPGNRRPSGWRSHCWSVYRQPTADARSATYRGGVDNRAEVKDFLTTRRARLTPQRAGLTAFSL